MEQKSNRRTRDAPNEKRKAPFTPQEQAEAVSDGLCIFGAISLSIGVGVLFGIGALLITAGICCIGIGYLIDRAARGSGG